VRKTQPLLSPFNSQADVFAQVYQLKPKSCSQALVHCSHHRKSSGVDLDVLSYAERSLTKRHAARCSVTFKSP